MDNNVTFDEMNELLDEIYHSGGETWVEIDGQTYYTDWGYGVVGIEFFIRMLKNRKSDNDATQTRQDVVANVDEIIEHVINGNMLNMPYDVYLELFDAVDGLGVEIENLQTKNAKLRELVRSLHMAYVGALNKCEGMDEGLIWEHCEMVDAELAKSHARFEADRHRFDVAMCELGIEVDG